MGNNHHQGPAHCSASETEPLAAASADVPDPAADEWTPDGPSGLTGEPVAPPTTPSHCVTTSLDAARVVEAAAEIAGAADNTVEPEPVTPLVSHDGLFTFGPSARLRPAPMQIADQSPEALEHVPDTAIDWVDLGFADVRAVSARGHMHRYLGEIRQDSFAIEATDSYLAIAVADGVGNASTSHLGSAVVARDSVRDVSLLDSIVAAEHDGSASLADLAVVLANEARKLKLEGRDVATTLVLAVVRRAAADDGSRDVTLAQIGDSTPWRKGVAGWVQLGEREADDDIVSTAVEPLPMHSVAKVWRETFRPGETLALVSDGVGNILPTNRSFSGELAQLWANSAPSPGDLLKVVDATVRSYDDDRTFVGVRFV